MLSSILVIGGTGMIGQHLVMASLDAGHPTALLVRQATAADPGKAKLLEDFKSWGALPLGDINDHEGLVTAIKQADVVISATGHSSPEEVESQLKIVAAIQEAGGVKGNLRTLDQLVSLWENKIGKTLEETYICEEELVKKVQESLFPLNFQLAVLHATLVAGEAKLTEKRSTATGPSTGEGVQATELYPDMKYVTVEEFLDEL